MPRYTSNTHHISSIKLIYIHVPKTGGTFLENKLRALASGKYSESRQMMGHKTINHYNDKIDEYTVFGVVRNPYDRIFSAYNSFVKGNKTTGKYTKPLRWPALRSTYIKLNRPKNFENFIENLYILFENNELPWQNCSGVELDKVCSSSTDFAVHLAPQYAYFINHKNEIGIDKENILRYESLDTELCKFLNNNYKDNQKVNTFFQQEIVSKVNIKKTYDIHNMYPELIDMIHEIYEGDFSIFNYDK